MPETVTATYKRGAVTFSALTSVADPATALMGWQLSQSTTGLASVGTSVSQLSGYTGSLNIPSGTRLYRKIINAGSSQIVMNSGVILEECQINSSRLGSQGAVWIKGGSGQKILNCDLILSGSGNEIAGVYADAANGVEITSLYESGGSIGIWLDTVPNAQPSKITKWWYGNQPTPGGAHRDGFTRRAGNVPVVLDTCSITIINPNATGAIFTQPTWGGVVGGVTVRNSYLAGGGYNVGLDHGYNSFFVNNRYTPTGWGPTSVDKSVYAGGWGWTDQYIYAASKTDAKGSVVPSPI